MQKNVQANTVKFKGKGVSRVDLRDIELHQLNGIYRDIAEHMGIQIAALIYDHYKGLQVTFPLRFIAPDCTKEKIRSEFNGANARELSRRHGYSERWIRKIVSDRSTRNP